VSRIRTTRQAERIRQGIEWAHHARQAREAWGKGLVTHEVFMRSMVAALSHTRKDPLMREARERTWRKLQRDYLDGVLERWEREEGR